MKPDDKISKHFSYKEIIVADEKVLKDLNIKNEPSEKELANIKILCEEVLDKLRDGLNVPIGLTSCYRSKIYNEYIGGAINSQHMARNGAAADIDCKLCGESTNEEIFQYIKNNLDFDQLIFEHGTLKEPRWVHVSYNKGKNRKQILRAIEINNTTVYVKYEH